MTAAWHGAAFQRAKRMPSLKSVLSEKNDSPYKSNDEMLAMLSGIRAQGIGIKIRKVG